MAGQISGPQRDAGRRRVSAIKGGWLHFEAVSRNRAASHFVSGILSARKRSLP
jgi:hypothetical protein